MIGHDLPHAFPGVAGDLNDIDLPHAGSGGVGDGVSEFRAQVVGALGGASVGVGCGSQVAGHSSIVAQRGWPIQLAFKRTFKYAKRVGQLGGPEEWL